MEIIQQRLQNQQLIQHHFATSAEVVHWLGAVQAQDYSAAKWALGQRAAGVTDEAIERACNEGTILRTHVMRPTWHFVAPTDIRWLLALTAPHVKAALAYNDKKCEITGELLARSHDIVTNALRDGQYSTRAELAHALERAGIAIDPLRVTHLVMHAELDGLICSGVRRGKQFTYALLDERAPQARTLDREEACAELARRYFTSHGPATLYDFSWWSGLKISEARASLAQVQHDLLHEERSDQTYWFAETSPHPRDLATVPTVHLLPNYDEYIVGYTDRSAIYDDVHTGRLDARGNVLFTHTIVLNGRIVGTWQRVLTRSTVMLTLQPFLTLSQAERHAINETAQRYGTFLGMAVESIFAGE